MVAWRVPGDVRSFAHVVSWALEKDKVHCQHRVCSVGLGEEVVEAFRWRDCAVPEEEGVAETTHFLHVRPLSDVRSTALVRYQCF